MTSQIFDCIVNVQDKSLTGTWNPIMLFLTVFLLVTATAVLKKTIKKQTFDMEGTVTAALQYAIIAVIINYVTGKLFVSREKMYKSKGFSNKSSRGQAYADARVGQFVAAVGGLM